MEFGTNNRGLRQCANKQKPTLKIHQENIIHSVQYSRVCVCGTMHICSIQKLNQTALIIIFYLILNTYSTAKNHNHNRGQYVNSAICNGVSVK